MPFAIGNYKDEVLCDVVPMEAGHILLSRSWQFDRKVTYNEYTNRLSFIYNKLKITLSPLSPKQVFVDQIKMRKAREYEKSKEKESERTKEKSKQKMRKAKAKRESEIKRVCFSNQPMLVLVYNEDVQDIFSTEVPSDLPSIRGIEHHIDLNPGEKKGSLLNKNTSCSKEEIKLFKC
ncbi:hypothetical protein CR513_52798, partial [Mucuna pruriens]